MRRTEMTVVVLGLAALLQSSPAQAQSPRGCKIFQGPYAEATDPGPPFVVSGRLEGGLQATYSFEVGTLLDLAAVDPVVAPSLLGVVGPVTVETWRYGTLMGSTIATRDAQAFGGNGDGARMFSLTGANGTTVRILFSELRIPEAPFVFRFYLASVCEG